MDKIPFMNLSDSHGNIKKEIFTKIEEIVDKNAFIGGPEVSEFEKEFAQYCGTSYAAGCSNGTDALILALKALDIGPGDAVITVPNTFIATAEAISSIGAEVIFVDVDQTSFTMSIDALVECIETNKGNKNIRAILPVHMFGLMADMEKISQIAKENNLFVVEDSCQAHGAEVNGKRPGFYSDVATFSFYPGKNIGAFGDAGAIVTNNESLYKKIKMLINHGRWNHKYIHEIPGYNKRIDSIQAAILRIKLKHINTWTTARIEKAEYYSSLLNDIKEIIIPSYDTDKFRHVFHLYVLRCKQRERLLEKLEQNSISYGIHYPVPLHLQPAFKNLGLKKGSFPITEKLSNEVVSLPLWPEIPNEWIEKIVDVIKDIFE